MSPALASLYPDEIRELMVIPRMPSPRKPNAPAGARNRGTAREFYGPAMVEEFRLLDGSHVAFIDKAFPHSRFDTMLLASDDDIRTAVSDLTAPAAEYIFGSVPRFAEYVSQDDVVQRFGLRGGRLHVSYNYDRDTTDRENSMFYDKRFHLHLNYFPARDIVTTEPIRWVDLPDRALAQRLVDPVAYLAEYVVRDVNTELGDLVPLMPVDRSRDLRLGLPAGAKFEAAGWSALGRRDTIGYLRGLHLAAERGHVDLYRAMTGQEFMPRRWSRPAMLPLEQALSRLSDIPWMSEESFAGASTLARGLRSMTEAEIEALRQDSARVTQLLTLGGLDYAISIAAPYANGRGPVPAQADVVHVTQQVKLFADIGGAGMPPIDGVPIVRLDRASGKPFSPAELRERVAFAEGFRIAYHQHSTHKGASA